VYYWNGTSRSVMLVGITEREVPLFATFNVLLTVLPGMILINNQLDAQFFMYVYYYSLNVSNSNVPIISRIIISMRNLVYVTLC